MGIKLICRQYFYKCFICILVAYRNIRRILRMYHHFLSILYIEKLWQVYVVPFYASVCISYYYTGFLLYLGFNRIWGLITIYNTINSYGLMNYQSFLQIFLKVYQYKLICIRHFIFSAQVGKYAESYHFS